MRFKTLRTIENILLASVLASMLTATITSSLGKFTETKKKVFRSAVPATMGLAIGYIITHYKAEKGEPNYTP